MLFWDFWRSEISRWSPAATTSALASWQKIDLLLRFKKLSFCPLNVHPSTAQLHSRKVPSSRGERPSRESAGRPRRQVAAGSVSHPQPTSLLSPHPRPAKSGHRHT